MEETLPAEGVFHSHGSFTGNPEDPLGRGSSVGRYTVLERIGSGGMGVVYSAFDPQLDRRIALKVMHPGKGGTVGPTGRTRLLREAQAMAKLSHPNVITVHDVGTYGDRVFVAMEFIEGGHLRDWQTLGERSWQEVVDAFVRAGRGLAAAHAVGLVHRDFKPDNVLMGTDGRVLVMDFGLARQATQKSALTPSDSSPILAARGQQREMVLTRTGAMLGTPAYMAPEQHKGDGIGPHADQFSFSVALYEGLYGQRPFAGTSVTSLAMNVLEGSVRAPPRDTKVPSWIRDIVLRGLSVEPVDRFASMDALLAELQRDPPQPRRPWVVAGISLGVAGTITIAYLVTRPDDKVCQDAPNKIGEVWSEAAKAKLHDDIVSSDVSYADSTWKSVSNSLDDYATRWAASYETRCKAHHDATRRAVRRTEDPGLLCLYDRRRDLAAFLEALTDADQHLRVLEESVTGAQRLRAPEDCRDLDDDLAEARILRPKQRAELDRLQVDLSRGRAFLLTRRSEEALEAARTIARGAERLEAPALHAEALELAAGAQLLAGDIGPAERDLRQAILSAASAQRGDLETEAWATMVEVVALRQGLYDQGRRIALGAEAAIARSGDAPELRARLISGLGAIAQAEGRFDEAVDHYERALEIRDEHLPADDLRRAETLEGIGVALEGLGRFADATEAHGVGLAMREQVLGAQHPDVARSLIRLGAAMQGDERIAAAEGALIRARMILDPDGEVPTESRIELEEDEAKRLAAMPHSLDLALCLDQLGLLRRAQEEFDEATVLHARAATILEGAGRSAAAGYPLENLGLSLADQGRHDEAVPRLRRALEAWKALPEGHTDLGFAHLNLANSLWAIGNVEDARVHYGRALNRWEDVLPDDHPYMAYALTGLGRAHLDLGEFELAVELLERAAEVRNHEDEDRLNVAETNLLLARALWAGQRDSQRAIELVIAARDAAGAYEPTDHTALRKVLAGEPYPRFTDQLVPAGLGVSNLARPR